MSGSPASARSRAPRPPDGGSRRGRGSGGWTFLSNHGHVLLCLAAGPRQTLPAIAERVGITSRAVQLILADLIEGGYVERVKIGRSNHYQIHADGRLRHPLESHHRIADLIAALGPPLPPNGDGGAPADTAGATAAQQANAPTRCRADGSR